MKYLLLSVCVVAALLVGCGEFRNAAASAALPIVYRNLKYDFTFYLPAEWRGYSVLMQQWREEPRPSDIGWIGSTNLGPVFVLRHPKWRQDSPYQDIPIRVFTREQWDGGGKGPPIMDAGGVEDEVAHNAKYVFAVHSRFNTTEWLTGWQGAGAIVTQNAQIHQPLLDEVN